MDREFYSADVMRTVAAGRRFLMPAVKNARVKEEIRKTHESGRTGGGAVPGFAIRNSEGRTARFSPVIVPSKARRKGGCP